MTDPALTAEEWVGVQRGTVGIVGTPDAKANHQVAAVALYGQPFGFTREDVEAVESAHAVLLRHHMGWESPTMARLASLRDRIAALLPPPESPA